MKTIKEVILAAPESLLKDGVLSFIRQEADLIIRETPVNVPELLAVIKQGLPGDTLLIDDDLFDELNPEELIRELKALHPELSILILSNTCSEQHLIHLLHSGISGCVLKYASRDELIFAIRHTLAGNHYICSGLYETITDRLSVLKSNDPGNPVIYFSDEEIQVMRLIIEGYSNQEIAYQLFTTKRAIMHYRESLPEKAGVPDMAVLLRLVLQQGVIQ